MDHSQAIMADAGKALDGASKPSNSTADNTSNNNTSAGETNEGPNGRKRKADFSQPRANQHGGRGGRGREGRRGRGGRGGRNNDGGRDQRGDMGRGEYFRDNTDKRQKIEEKRERRQREGNEALYATKFSEEEIKAEDRRPKKKVAVMIGYAGTGYKGMQLTAHERTIEGDLFKAFVDAGAISKANADDPKKSGLVRCARTDKGVHAAGNMISLKLIIEDEDIVEKINSHLTPQIRVWGFVQTTGSFSCYQACDSRWYEYLIPSHAFLPPHPSSWLAKKLEEIADEAGDREGYNSRQAEVQGFWQKVDENEIAAILETIDEDIRWEVVKALQGEEEASAKTTKIDADPEPIVKIGGIADDPATQNKAEDAAIIINDVGLTAGSKVKENAIHVDAKTETEAEGGVPVEPTEAELREAERQRRIKDATKELRRAYATAKRHYRIPKVRIDRVQEALSKYVGTVNYHNFTIQKTHKDPSAKRHIKSFVVNPKPILIGDGPDENKSEWLSLKVHGQSFMMHQIRKMIGMVTLLVRCGSELSNTLDDSFTASRYSIPKVPGLGLLLERPVFDSYNTLTATKYEREPLLFSKYEDKIEEFKQREIYERIFREEEERNEFTRFFNHIDNFKEPYFLYVSSKGIEAAKVDGKKAPTLADVDSEDEGDANAGEG